jgi:hypothetical protein
MSHLLKFYKEGRVRLIKRDSSERYYLMNIHTTPRLKPNNDPKINWLPPTWDLTLRIVQERLRCLRSLLRVLAPFQPPRITTSTSPLCTLQFFIIELYTNTIIVIKLYSIVKDL